MKTANEWRSIEDDYTLPVYSRYPIVLERGEGTTVWDTDGKAYLDFYGGHAVALVGHCHPEVVAAIQDQASKLLFHSNIVYCPTRAGALEAIDQFTEGRYQRVFFVNSGAEAAEVAAKIAVARSGRRHFVSLKNGWHGRTGLALGVTGVEAYRAPFRHVLSDVTFVECGDTASLEAAITNETAAFFAEPIMSMGGICNAEPEFYQRAKALCEEVDAVYVSDEVQCGWGRTGLPFGFDAYGILPDILMTAKGMAGGIPAGAVLCTEEVAAEVKSGEHGSTFGGGPVATRAIETTLTIIMRDKLVERSEEMGTYLRNKLLRLDFVQAVTGRGLLVGIRLAPKVKHVVEQLLTIGVIVGASADPHLMRVIPPLTVKTDECDRFAEALTEAVTAL